MDIHDYVTKQFSMLRSPSKTTQAFIIAKTQYRCDLDCTKLTIVLLAWLSFRHCDTHLVLRYSCTLEHVFQLCLARGRRCKTHKPIWWSGLLIVHQNSCAAIQHYALGISKTLLTELKLLSNKLAIYSIYFLPSGSLHLFAWPHQQGLRIAQNPYGKSCTTSRYISTSICVR